MRRKKNVAEYCEKVLAMLYCEEEIAHLRLAHPEVMQCLPVHRSSLHWKGHISGLVELISSLDYSNRIQTESGEKQSFAAIVSSFEWLFNVSIDKPYDERAKLSLRKRRLSILLTELKTAFEKNIITCYTHNK